MPQNILLQRKMLRATLVTLVLIVISILFIDRPLSLALRDLPHDITDAFKDITNFGKGVFWILGSAALALIFWGLSRLYPQNPHFQRWCRMAVFAFCAFILSSLLIDILKMLAGRARPILLLEQNVFGFFGPLAHRGDARYQSMPSGHADIITVLALLIRYYWPRFMWLGYALAFILVISRPIVEAHYLSDIMMGALIGWLVTTLLLAKAEEKGWLAK